MEIRGVDRGSSDLDNYMYTETKFSSVILQFYASLESKNRAYNIHNFI